ncbi:hypothetical protein Lal_00040405, partial [Lupinus albus]
MGLCAWVGRFLFYSTFTNKNVEHLLTRIIFLYAFKIIRFVSVQDNNFKYAHFSRCNRLHHVGNRLQSDDTFLKQKPKHIFGLEFEEKRERRAFQEKGALGLILELENRVNMNVGNEDVKDK